VLAELGVVLLAEVEQMVQLTRVVVEVDLVTLVGLVVLVDLV
jgi:hypothetical protein